MNHVYRLVFNRALGLLQVTAETGSQQKKSAGGSGAVGAVATPPAAVAFGLQLRRLAAAIALALGFVAMPAMAATYTVTEASDDGTGGTANTLSWAINQANGDPGSVIAFDSGLTFIDVTGALPAISADVTLQASSDVEIEGGLSGGGAQLSTSGTGVLTFSVGGAFGGDYGAYADGASINGAGTGGSGGSGGDGGLAMQLAGADLSNGATVSGGNGGSGSGGSVNGPGTGGSAGSGGAGGDGAVGSDFTMTNNGTVAGGNGGAADGGLVNGDGIGGSGGLAGGGGVGVRGTDFTLSNTGTIAGGHGGSSNGGLVNGTGNGGNGGTGGDGGAGVEGADFTLTNSGTISGGDGGTSAGGFSWGVYGADGTAGEGGVGVSSTGGATIINSGTIAAGSNQSNAIELSGGGNALTLQDGSTISGNVVSSSGSTNGGDTLTLEGTATNNTLAANQYQGFVSRTKTGTGTWALTGTTTEVTPWEIEQGTLSIASDAALGDVSGDLTLSGGTLHTSADITSARDIALTADSGIDNGGNDNTFSGVISGNGDLTLAGSGSTVLSGTNTYVGNTIVDGGTLVIASDANLGAAGGSLTLDHGELVTTADFSTARAIAVTGDAATLDNDGNDATFSGVISGDTGVVVTGAGTTTFSGSNTYQLATGITGGATLSVSADNNLGDAANSLQILGGTLLTTADFVSARDILLAGDAALDNDGNDNTFSGDISGVGDLIITGAGTTTLSGTHSYFGATTVEGGATLALVDGVDLTASDEIVLDYLSTLLADNVATSSIGNSGTVAISAGSVLSVDGDFTSTGTFRTSVASASSYGQLDVSGTANLGGDLFVDVVGAPSLAHNSVLSDVISAGSVNGTFATIADNSALFDFEMVYSATGMDLTILSTSPTGVEEAVTSVGNHPAQGAARVFDQLIGSGGGGGTTVPGSLQMSDVITVLGQQGSQQAVSAVVSETLPVLVGSSLFAAEGSLTNINQVIGARVDTLQGLASGNDFFTDRHLWLKPFGSWANQDDRDGVSGFDANTTGLVLGADAAVGDNSTVGLAFGYAQADVDGNDSAAPQSMDVDVYQLIGYGSYKLGGNRVLSYQLDIGHNSNSGERQLPTFDVVAKSDYDSSSIHAGVGLGQTFQLGDALQVTPELRADYTRIEDDSYQETGAGALNLDVDSRSFEQLIVGVDGKFAYQISAPLTLAANLGVGYDTIADDGAITSAFAGAPSAAFATQGLERERWVGQAGLGLTYQVNDAVDMSVRYDAEARSGFDNQTVSAKLRWMF